MNIWRIGSKWGDYDLQDIFKKHNIAFAGSEVENLITKVKKDDLVAVTSGQTIIAVGKVLKRIDLSAINKKYISEFDDVYALKFEKLYFADDLNLNFGIYAGQGKQFHEAHGKYITLIKNNYKLAISSSMTENIKKILETNKNIVLTGAPGTGKTYLAKEIIAKKITDIDKIELVQFHPSYDYTDFVEGLRPVKEKNKELGFKLKNGIFKEFCKRAKNDSKNKYVFIIDEINRAEISKVFGELFFSIDPGYRGKTGKVKTQYANLQSDETIFDNELGQGWFYIPENVYIIGTMNDIDRSVESFDFAMRRRFAWIEVKAIDRIDMWNGQIDKLKEKAKKRMINLNNAIYSEETKTGIEGLNSSYHIGPAYFLKLKYYKENPFQKLWDNHIQILLAEYLRGFPDADEKIKQLQSEYAKQ